MIFGTKARPICMQMQGIYQPAPPRWRTVAALNDQAAHKHGAARPERVALMQGVT